MKKIALLLLITLFPIASFSQSYNDFTLTDLENNDVTLSSLLEKGPVMISFWALWCAPCKEEMKKLAPVYEKFKDRGFTYLAVNQDNQKSVAKVKSYITANGYSFPVVLDTDKKIFEMYNGIGMPYSLLITPDKKIYAKHLGYVTGDEAKIEKEIEDALEASKTKEDTK